MLPNSLASSRAESEHTLQGDVSGLQRQSPFRALGSRRESDSQFGSGEESLHGGSITNVAPGVCSGSHFAVHGMGLWLRRAR